MPRIYACYRREDNPHVVGRVVGDLRSCFGTETVFHDIDCIQIGDEWPERLERALDTCEILLVFIGKDWHQSWDDNVGPRLWHKDDWVRREICAGLDSNTTTVIPLLIDDAHPPKKTALPTDCSLSRISDMHYSRIRHADYEADIEKLIRRIGTKTQSERKVEDWLGLTQMQVHQILGKIETKNE